MHSTEIPRLFLKLLQHRETPLGAAAEYIVNEQNIYIDDNSRRNIEAGKEWLHQNNKLVIFTIPHTNKFDGATVQESINDKLIKTTPDNCKWLVSVKNFNFEEIKPILQAANVDFSERDYKRLIPATDFQRGTRQYAKHKHFERIPVVQQSLQDWLLKKYPDDEMKLRDFFRAINNVSGEKIKNFMMNPNEAGLIATFSEGTSQSAGGLNRANIGVEDYLKYPHVRVLCVRLDHVEEITKRTPPRTLGPHTHKSIQIQVRELIDLKKLREFKREFKKQFRWKDPKDPTERHKWFTNADALMKYTAGDDLPERIPGVDPYGAYSDEFIERIPQPQLEETVIFEAK